MGRFHHFVFVGALLLVFFSLSGARAEGGHEAARKGLEKTTATLAQNVILITADGLRWEEVFRGVDVDMITTTNQVRNPEAFRLEFDAETTAARREKLMPFFWSFVAENGVVYGNRDRGSAAHVINNFWFSYPGYNEFLCGFADDERIKSNNKLPNPNATVFEWLRYTPGFDGRVAAFGAWDVFPYIFNSAHCGFPVDGGDRTFSPPSGTTPVMDVINRIRMTTPERWNGAHFDSLVYPMAIEYLKTQKPRALYIGLGETDEWAHEGNYEQYLHAVRRVDSWLEELWNLTQSLPEYKGRTTLIFTCDHGRGESRTDDKAWNSHGRSTAGSGEVWMAVWGPDTPASGEIPGQEFRLGQVASTVAAALGYDYNAAQPKAALQLPGAFAGQHDAASRSVE